MPCKYAYKCHLFAQGKGKCHVGGSYCGRFRTFEKEDQEKERLQAEKQRKLEQTRKAFMEKFRLHPL